MTYPAAPTPNIPSIVTAFKDLNSSQATVTAQIGTGVDPTHVTVTQKVTEDGTSITRQASFDIKPVAFSSSTDGFVMVENSYQETVKAVGLDEAGIKGALAQDSEGEVRDTAWFKDKVLQFAFSRNKNLEDYRHSLKSVMGNSYYRWYYDVGNENTENDLTSFDNGEDATNLSNYLQDDLAAIASGVEGYDAAEIGLVAGFLTNRPNAFWDKLPWAEIYFTRALLIKAKESYAGTQNVDPATTQLFEQSIKYCEERLTAREFDEYCYTGVMPDFAEDDLVGRANANCDSQASNEENLALESPDSWFGFDDPVVSAPSKPNTANTRVTKVTADITHTVVETIVTDLPKILEAHPEAVRETVRVVASQAHALLTDKEILQALSTASDDVAALVSQNGLWFDVHGNVVEPNTLGATHIALVTDTALAQLKKATLDSLSSSLKEVPAFLQLNQTELDKIATLVTLQALRVAQNDAVVAELKRMSGSSEMQGLVSLMAQHYTQYGAEGLKAFMESDDGQLLLAQIIASSTDALHQGMITALDEEGKQLAAKAYVEVFLTALETSEAVQADPRAQAKIAELQAMSEPAVKFIMGALDEQAKRQDELRRAILMTSPAGRRQLKAEDAAAQTPVRPHAESKATALDFVEEAISQADGAKPKADGSYTLSWDVGAPTKAGFGGISLAGQNVSVESLVTKILALDSYVGNVATVEVSTPLEIADLEENEHPVYHRLNIAPLGQLQYKISLVDNGTMTSPDGKKYRVIYWYQLDEETKALETSNGFRNAENAGFWLIGFDDSNPTIATSLAYGLMAYPRKEDVSGGTWFILTTGADAGAGVVINKNLTGMVEWAKKP